MLVRHGGPMCEKQSLTQKLGAQIKSAKTPLLSAVILHKLEQQKEGFAIFYAGCWRRKTKESDTNNKNGENILSLCYSNTSSSALCSSKPLAPLLWFYRFYHQVKFNSLYRY